ncbi:MAG: DUF6146 family protein [Flavobacterium sp.]|jgi:hypothetical protein
MKTSVLLFLFILFYTWSCKPTKTLSNDKNITSKNDTLRIANDSLEYELIIIEPGFNGWLASRPQQRGFYTQNFLEARNRVWVLTYNNRVFQNPALYHNTIDYQQHINYGYEVNFLLYHYLLYFQQRYQQNLGGFSTNY